MMEMMLSAGGDRIRETFESFATDYELTEGVTQFFGSPNYTLSHVSFSTAWGFPPAVARPSYNVIAGEAVLLLRHNITTDVSGFTSARVRFPASPTHETFSLYVRLSANRGSGSYGTQSFRVRDGASGSVLATLSLSGSETLREWERLEIPVASITSGAVQLETTCGSSNNVNFTAAVDDMEFS